MDEQSLLNGPDPEPQAGTAAEAFARLTTRVEAMEQRLDGRLAVVARTLESIAIEKQSIEISNYDATFLKLNGNMAEIVKRMKAVEQSASLRMTPKSMGEEIMMVAEDARAADKATIKQLLDLNRHTIAAMNQATGTRQAKEEERRHLFYAIGITALAASLLWLVYPGWASSMAPNSWHWPERVARRTMGELSLWDAGIRLMHAGNPEGWQAIVDAADMRQANRDTIAACEGAAEKAKEPVRCIIRIGR